MKPTAASISPSSSSIDEENPIVKLVEVNWSPTDRQLRQFGVISLIALPFIAWLWNGSTSVIVGLAAAGAVLGLVGFVAPRVLKPVFLALVLVSLPIGLVVGELAMLLIFFGVFLPIGLCFRIMRRDSLQRKLDRQAKSYWQAKPQPRGPAAYYRQS
jgi:hypothetical protein